MQNEEGGRREAEGGRPESQIPNPKCRVQDAECCMLNRALKAEGWGLNTEG